MTFFPLRQGSDHTLYARHGDGLVRDFHPLPRGIGIIIAQSEGNVKGETDFTQKKDTSGEVSFVYENYSSIAAFWVSTARMMAGSNLATRS